MGSIIYHGILERFPTVKIAAGQGRGFLPHYIGAHGLQRDRVDRIVIGGDYPVGVPDPMAELHEDPIALCGQHSGVAVHTPAAAAGPGVAAALRLRGEWVAGVPDSGQLVEGW